MEALSQTQSTKCLNLKNVVGVAAQNLPSVLARCKHKAWCVLLCPCGDNYCESSGQMLTEEMTKPRQLHRPVVAKSPLTWNTSWLHISIFYCIIFSKLLGFCGRLFYELSDSFNAFNETVMAFSIFNENISHSRLLKAIKTFWLKSKNLPNSCHV